MKTEQEFGVSRKEAETQISSVRHEIGRVIIGQEKLIDRLLIALLSKIPYSFKGRGQEKSGCGHVLLEGVPGLAKTLAVTAIARAIDAQFQRIQFTPDLMPADIVGTRVYEASSATFSTEKGPIFAHIVLADEINRGTPKTQSALLEAMQERQVTISEETFAMPEPFWVLATQNPLEHEGVYVLPEAQLDRFAMKIVVRYPGAEDEEKILHLRLVEQEIQPVISPQQVGQIQDLASQVSVEPQLYRYIVRLGRVTRNEEDGSPAVVGEMVQHGISSRSLQHLLALARTHAFMAGREYVLPKDVKAVAVEALQHRIVRTIRAETEGVSGEEIMTELLKQVALYE
ncbi:AAA family ATPase [Acidobacteria bacterium AH-259-D05]|nr:AAA family ATPase [Acidobacteria bacterium AH-259-D05]